jgi:hypothetical protein
MGLAAGSDCKDMREENHHEDTDIERQNLSSLWKPGHAPVAAQTSRILLDDLSDVPLPLPRVRHKVLAFRLRIPVVSGERRRAGQLGGSGSDALYSSSASPPTLYCRQKVRKMNMVAFHRREGDRATSINSTASVNRPALRYAPPTLPQLKAR